MELKGHMAAKLAAAGAGLLLAVVMLVMGTFAWFTVNTKAEVGGISVSFVNDGTQWPFEFSINYRDVGYDEDAATWLKEIDISQYLPRALLRPISTYDLEHWYSPTYDAAGSVAGFQETPLSMIANHVESEAAEAEGTNCLVYADVWVRTRDPNTAYDLKLSNPSTNADGTFHLNDDETDFGTFVLWTPVWDTQTGHISTASANDAMASVRVGFAVSSGDGSQAGETFTPYIFEPNADLHKGLGTSAEEQADVAYLDGVENKTVGNYNAAAGAVFTTSVPHSTGIGYEMANQPTFYQTESTWDQTKLAALESISGLDSNCIGTIGMIEDAPSLATVKKGEPRLIRIYFWLEGQDVDCWNQIIGGSLYANLEFRGDTVSGN